MIKKQIMDRLVNSGMQVGQAATFVDDTLAKKTAKLVIKLVWCVHPDQLHYCNGWENKVINATIVQIYGF